MLKNYYATKKKDLFKGINVQDFVSFENATSGVTVDLGNPKNNKGTFVVGDTYTKINNLYGSNYNDKLIGNINKNILSGLDGKDTLIGGDGDDTYILDVNLDDEHQDKIIETSSKMSGIDTIRLKGMIPREWQATSEFDLAPNIEILDASNIKGSCYELMATGNSKDNTLIGTNLDDDDSYDYLNGAAGNDLIKAGKGNDVLIGGPGKDTMDGGDGHDWARYFYLTDITNCIKVNLNGSSAVTVNISYNSSDRDTLKNIENIIGGAGNDEITGDSHINYLDGFRGDDILDGRDGDDILGGDLGNDKIYGGNGNDYLVGEEGDDKLDGESGNDTLDGGSGYDLVEGGAGNDVIKEGEHIYFGSKLVSGIAGDASVGGGVAQSVGIDTITLNKDFQYFYLSESVFGELHKDVSIYTKDFQCLNLDSLSFVSNTNTEIPGMNNEYGAFVFCADVFRYNNTYIGSGINADLYFVEKGANANGQTLEQLIGAQKAVLIADDLTTEVYDLKLSSQDFLIV